MTTGEWLKRASVERGQGNSPRLVVFIDPMSCRKDAHDSEMCPCKQPPEKLAWQMRALLLHYPSQAGSAQLI